MTPIPTPPPCPRRCVECPDPPEHHWLEDCDEETGWAGYTCKHCETRAEICVDCFDVRAVVRIDGDTLCADCAGLKHDWVKQSGEALWICNRCRASYEPRGMWLVYRDGKGFLTGHDGRDTPPCVRR